MVPIRFFCFLDELMLVAENVLAMAVVLATTTHFLFYCRGLKFVGPFVLMVYKILMGDMIRFLLIYSFFMIGFAQGMEEDTLVANLQYFSLFRHLPFL